MTTEIPGGGFLQISDTLPETLPLLPACVQIAGDSPISSLEGEISEGRTT